jgi:hypothetical protein
LRNSPASAEDSPACAFAAEVAGAIFWEDGASVASKIGSAAGKARWRKDFDAEDDIAAPVALK